MNQSSVSTAIFLAGLLYLLMPPAVWLVMNKQHTRTVVHWCLGGMVFGLGAIGIGLRDIAPEWVTFPLANAALIFGSLLQIQALRIELGRAFRGSHLACLMVGFVLTYEFFRWVIEADRLRFFWGAACLMFTLGYLSYLAWCLSKAQDSKSARWMMAIHAFGSMVMLIRLFRVTLGFASPQAAAPGIDTVVNAVAILLTAVVGSFSFVGLFFERSVKRDILLAKEQVRQQENARLNAQIASLDRQRILGAMSASLSHELNQPLTAILLEANMVQRGMSTNTLSSKELAENIHAIEHNTRRASQIIERIRNFIRPDKAVRQVVNVPWLVEEVQQLLASQAKAKHVHFEFQNQAAQAQVMGDPIQLSQVLVNVYRNAIEALATSTTKQVMVRTLLHDNEVWVQVTDSGSGFMDEAMAHIGEAFFTTKPEGLGVGLNISRTIAEQHGGGLRVANATGGGAQVTLVLPLCVPDTSQLARDNLVQVPPT